jgi:hypothetical protein
MGLVFRKIVLILQPLNHDYKRIDNVPDIRN